MTRGEVLAQQAFNEKWPPGFLAMVVDKLLDAGVDLTQEVSPDFWERSYSGYC